MTRASPARIARRRGRPKGSTVPFERDRQRFAIAILYARGLLDCPEHEAALALAQVSARELMQTPNFGQVSLNALRAWLADHGCKLCPESAHAFVRRMRGSPTKSGAPMRERPSVSETGPSQAGRNEDVTPCPYTTKAT